MRFPCWLLFVLLFLCAPPLVAEDAVDAKILERWTPGGDTNAYDLPYHHRFAPYEKHQDPDWVDHRWQQTDKGPFLSHSFSLPGFDVGPKLLAIAAGPEKFLLYDQTAGSFVASVIDGELRTDAARFGLLNAPSIQGEVAFHVPASELWSVVNQSDNRKVVVPLGSSECDYQGLHVHGDRVLLVNRIAGVEVLETATPDDDAGMLTREIELGPRDIELRLAVAQQEQFLVVLVAATEDVRLEVVDGKIVVCFPASEDRSYARVSYAKGEPPTLTAETVPTDNDPGLAALKEPGPKRWGEPLVTSGVLADESESALVVDRITVPHENPFGALFFLAGLAFFDNGDAAVCSAHGDVWIVRGLDADLQHVTWQRFATGLYQPLGLEIVDGKVYVLGRDQITRLHDLNHNGEADFYESFSHDLVIQGHSHAYAMRLQREADGSFLFLKSGEPPHGSALLRVSPDGEQLNVVARGFRHPFGLGVGPHGEITVADNEGNWVPSSKIDLIEEGGFYGFLGSATDSGESPIPAKPLCYLPKVADNSSGGQFWNSSPDWLDYHRYEMFHFSWGRCTIHAVLQQSVGDIKQAATVQIPGVELESGPAEAAFHPLDGQLYVVGLNGWQTGAKADGSFERVRSTGKPLSMPSGFAAHTDGIEIEFTVPLDRHSAESLASFQVEQWNYLWSGVYGSYHYSVSDPERVGHDAVAVERVTLSPDGKRVFLQIGDLAPVDQLHVAIDAEAADGTSVKSDLYATIHALAAAKNKKSPAELLAKENLVAWCIVPFDAKGRGPEERAAMLAELGIRKVAYDWRVEHIPTFDEELAAYARNGITLHAFWTPVNTLEPLSERHWPIVLDLIDRHGVTPELWVMLNNSLLDSVAEADRPRRAAEMLEPVVRAAAERNCQVGLYNHGGWFGEPDNQIRIIEVLRTMQLDNVGLVYNFHHGHEHAPNFPELAQRMQPYLLTVNVNGMRDGGPKILPYGSGDYEVKMLEALTNAGYRGPIGILDHREELDARQSLEENLAGMRSAEPTNSR